MIDKLNLFFSILFFSSFFSQDIYERYPAGQSDYNGGNVQFYKDFHQVLKEKKLQPCKDRNEGLNFRIVVYPDKKIKYVKTEDSETLEKNKCTFELAKEVAKYLKGWNPAVIDNQKVAAMTSFWIIPHELFQELQEGYDPVNDMQMATYEGGINNFRKKVFQGIDVSRFTFTGTVKLAVTFVVETDGKLSSIKLAESSGLPIFDDMIIKAISQIKNKWTPGNIHGIPVRYNFRLPLVFTVD